MAIILFVCTANIARSPMAAALFNKMIEEMGLSHRCQAQSTGTWGKDGLPAAVDGVQVMQARAIDISAHRSRIVTREIIDSAAIILTMERGHKEALTIEFSHKKDRIYLLTEMIGPGYDIPDPYGKGLQDFEETAAELEAIIDKGVDEILRRACVEFFEK